MGVSRLTNESAAWSLMMHYHDQLETVNEGRPGGLRV
jgi:hypothetical protein